MISGILTLRILKFKIEEKSESIKTTNYKTYIN